MSLIVMAIPVNVVVSTVANSHLSLLVTILKLNFQSKGEMKTVKKFSLSKKEIQTVLHLPVSIATYRSVNRIQSITLFQLVQHLSTSWLSLQQLLLFLYLSLLSHVWSPREEEIKHNAIVPVFLYLKLQMQT